LRAKDKVMIFTGKRKTAIAQVLVKKGSGKVTINGVPVEILEPEVARMRIIQTLLLAEEVAKQYDFEARVRGGGFMGRAEAVSIAIARALVTLSGKKSLRDLFEEFDRTLIAGDPRRTEPKKFGGPGPRRRKQTSYR